jgi:hypothetical protein
LASKRVRIALAGFAVWVAARFGLELDPAAVDKVIDLAMVLIGSFAVTGFGKERQPIDLAALAEQLGKLGLVRVEATATTNPPPLASTTPASPLAPRAVPVAGQPGGSPGVPLSEARAMRDAARPRPTPNPEEKP